MACNLSLLVHCHVAPLKPHIEQQQQVAVFIEKPQKPTAEDLASIK